jgi:16S rRNA G966 N2-methylase RsmD
LNIRIKINLAKSFGYCRNILIERLKKSHTLILREDKSILRYITSTIFFPHELSKLPIISSEIFAKQLLNEKGWLIVEHQSNLDLSNQSHFFEKRNYGQSTFSFFKNTI